MEYRGKALRFREGENVLFFSSLCLDSLCGPFSLLFIGYEVALIMEGEDWVVNLNTLAVSLRISGVLPPVPHTQLHEELCSIKNKRNLPFLPLHPKVTTHLLCIKPELIRMRKKLNHIGWMGFVLLCKCTESCSYDTLTLTSMPSSPTSEDMRLHDRKWSFLSILKNSSVIYRIGGWLGTGADLNASKIKIFPAGNSILIPGLFTDWVIPAA